MLATITQYWFSVLTRGLLLLLLGFIALFSPEMTSEAVVLYLGFMSLLLLLLSAYLGLKANVPLKNRLFHLFTSLVDGTVAYFCLLETSRASSILLLIIGLWAVLMGVSIVVLGLQASGASRFLIIINGSLSIALGFFLYFNPFDSSNMNYMAGFYMVLLSIFLIYLSIKMRKMYHESQEAKAEQRMQETIQANK